MYQVRKRNGDSVIFDLSKIQTALTKSFESCNRNYQDVIVEKLAMKAVARAEQKIKDNLLYVEDIQDAVESVLMSYGYEDVAKAYILYRKQHEKARNAQETVLDYKKTMEGYLKAVDWRVKENSTVTYSLGGLILGNSGAMTANYWLSEIYDEEISNAHRNCDFHIHDLSMLSPYCAGWSLKQLIKEGLGGVRGKIASKPAKHLFTLCNQMVNFLGILQNEWAGAQAFSSVDTYLAPFVKYEDLSYVEVKQCIESLVFGLNTPSRWGCVPLDTEVLSVDGFKKYDELKEGDLIYTYKDGVLELNPVNKVVIKKFTGKMHSYTSRNYNQTVTSDHRVLVRKHNSDDCIIKYSSDIFDVKTPYALPVSFRESAITDDGLNNDLVTLAAMVYTDGSFDFRGDTIHKVIIYKSPKRFGNDLIKNTLESLGLSYSVTEIEKGFGKINKYSIYGDSARFICDLCGGKHSIDSKFMKMTKEHAELFLNVWASFDGSEERMMCQYDNDTIKDQLQQIAILSGKCSYVVHDVGESGVATNYVKIRKADGVYPTERSEADYDGEVWCPSVDNGTAVFRNGDCVYISGQCQAPFSNFTFDWVVPDDLAELNCIVGGEEVDFKYKDCKREMDMINRAFMEVMIEGDANGRGFQYPIPTYSITKEFDWDTESINNKLLFEMTAKYGIPYFSNYVNSDMKPSDIRSMCCRLRLDLRELRRKNGGYFGSGESTGSVGVVTINMPRLAYKSKSETEFFDNLNRLMDIAARSLHIKRSVVSQYLENGLYPYTKRYLGNLNNHFSTLAVLGMNEACLNASWIRDNIASDAGYSFSKKVLDHMRDRLSDYQELYPGELFNLESAPAESTTLRFALHDKKDFPDIITAGDSTDGAPYYTNSSHLPVGYTDDIFTALDHQDDLQTKYTSGTVFHAFLGEKLPNWESAMMLTKKIAENYKLPYFTFSPTYSICPDHGYIRGEEWTCPECGKKTEVYSRVTGYYRAVQNFNDGKAHEFKDRKEYKVGDLTASDESCDACSTGYTELPEQSIEEDTETAVRKILAPTRKPMLFTTATCPNCKMAKRFISEAGFDCDILLAEENAELVNLYKVSQAPTLIVFNDGEPQTISNVSNIRKYLESINK